MNKEVFEKRRRKFQEPAPLNKVQGKKIVLQSKSNESNERDSSEPSEASKPTHSSQRSRAAVLKDSSKESLNTSKRDEKERKRKAESDREIEPEDDEDRKSSTRHQEESSSRVKMSVIGDDDANEDVEDKQEDLRAKLIKRKLKAQQNQRHHVGSGRIFSEALKGTRLLSTVVAATKNSSSSRRESNNSSSSSSSSNKKNLGRKVSLVKS
jgi:hypothetical protein